MADTKRGNWAERGEQPSFQHQKFVCFGLIWWLQFADTQYTILKHNRRCCANGIQPPALWFSSLFSCFCFAECFSLWCFIGGPWLVWQQNTDVQTLEVAHALLPRVKYSFKSKTKAEKWLFDRSSLRPSCIHYVHRLKQKSALTQNVKHKQNIQTIVVRNTWGCKRLTPIQKR